jgi:hypothetical protein
MRSYADQSTVRKTNTLGPLSSAGREMFCDTVPQFRIDAAYANVIWKEGEKALALSPPRFLVPANVYAFCATMNFLISGEVVLVLGSKVNVVLWR